MKWFWYSLIGFCLLMCSCKTKKVAHENNFVSKEKTKTNYAKYQALVDTTRILKIGIDKSKLTITEHITITKYDKTGAITEKTETERKIAQDSDEVVAEEEAKGVKVHLHDSLNHFRGATQKVESETKEESVGTQDSFGKWLGIVLGIGFLILIAYLCWKLKPRVN